MHHHNDPLLAVARTQPPLRAPSPRPRNPRIGPAPRHPLSSLAAGLCLCPPIGPQRLATPHQTREQCRDCNNKVQGNQFSIKMEDEAELGCYKDLVT